MTKRDRKYGENTDSRGADGKFGPGNAGKPKGARHRATQAAERLLEGEAEALARKAVELALEGDTTALRLCLERILPTRKGRPISFDLPDLTNSGDVRAAALSLLRSVAEGDVTPEEASATAPLIEAVRKAIETDEIVARLDAIERAQQHVTRKGHRRI